MRLLSTGHIRSGTSLGMSSMQNFSAAPTWTACQCNNITITDLLYGLRVEHQMLASICMHSSAASLGQMQNKTYAEDTHSGP